MTGAGGRDRAVVLPMLLALGTLFPGAPAFGADDAIPGRIIGAALVESRAYEKLTWLCDRIGHRLSGSPALEQAVSWAAAEFRRDGLEHVWTEEVMVPHWVRGHAAARIVAPVERPLALLALGGSVATPPEGVEAQVIEVDSFEALGAVAANVPGKIVLFNRAMQGGSGSGESYGSVVGLRSKGAVEAAKLGAVAMLIRSLGSADFRLPHTGAMNYEDDVRRIPAAAISAEDAMLISRLAASGESVRVHLELGPRDLGLAESANVIAELRGRERPDEIVLIGAHLDSWDVGQGAHDDGAGSVVVMETMRLLARHGLVPRRTIRAVLFTNEENGLAGGRDYARRHDASRHVVAIESDGGGAAPLGFGVSAGAGGVDQVREIARHLAGIRASEVVDSGGGADISPLKNLGVPVMSLRQDGSRYFDYHHTEADTLDKVQRADLDRNVAALALMAYMLAEARETLPRLPAEPGTE